METPANFIQIYFHMVIWLQFFREIQLCVAPFLEETWLSKSSISCILVILPKILRKSPYQTAFAFFLSFASVRRSSLLKRYPLLHQVSSWNGTLCYTRCPRGVMVKAMNCGIVVREFVLQSRYYVHFRANTIGKGMNPLILPPAMGKIVGRTRFFSLGEATSLGEGKLWIQTC